MTQQDKNSLQTADPEDASTWSSPPSRLLIPSAAPCALAGVKTRPQLLPVDQLAWENFERLCLRLLDLAAEPVHVSDADPAVKATAAVVRPYGVRGQAQSGIDVYARDRLVAGETPPDRRFVSLQARRIEKLYPAALRRSVDDFLGGKWASVSRKFIYATSASASATELADEIETQVSRLIGESIEFVVWDEETISTMLKNCPELVDDFFGREWVKQFCGDVAAQRLGTRLDAMEVASLRRDLDKIYRAAFGVSDSGQIAFRWARTPTVALSDRFVTPDLVSSTPQAASLSQPVEGLVEVDIDEPDEALLLEAAESNVLVPDEDAWFLRSSGRKRCRLAESHRVSERVPADQWIGMQTRQVIVGEPGTGKSTLLRHLVLDLLSEEPRWREVAARWGKRLPVWLPFHFLTQRVADRTGAGASVGEALKAWLEQNDSGHVWPLVEAALKDERLLLVVDGLDEWVSDDAGRYGLTALQTFADARSVPLIVSTRPFGLDRLTLGADWTHSRIAPLTLEQQRMLASHYFHANVGTEEDPSAERVIERSVVSFLSQIRGAPDLRAISEIPLFLVLLVGLHLSSNAKLPAGRFEVYDRAVQLLVADHRAQRRAAAAVTAPRQGLSDAQLRTVLAKVAFVSQLRGDLATVPQTELRKDFIDALRDTDGLAMEPAAAAATADELIAVAEGELGILVRMGPTNLGFLHRMLQEQLAAEYISDRYSLAETTVLFAERVGDPRWREVILATIWRIKRPAEMRKIMAALRARVDGSPAGLRARELVAELTFGPYDLPAVEIQRSAPDIIEAIETHSYGPHRARLLDSVLIGLEGAATRDIGRGCLERWTLLCQEPSSELVRAIAEVPASESSSETICTMLLRALRYPDSAVAYTSGLGIANRCSDSGVGTEEERSRLRDGLLQVLSDPPSALAVAAALVALALEWRDDQSVDDILKEARAHGETSVRVVALSDALGVLRPVFSRTPKTPTHDDQPLSADDSEWLFGCLEDWPNPDSHEGLLVAAIAEVARSRDSALEFLIDTLQEPHAQAGYRNRDLTWSVTLAAFANDCRVVDLVCDQLRDTRSSLVILITTWNRHLLASSYPVESNHNRRIAEAVEDLVAQSDGSRKILDFALPGLAAVDRGPRIKTLLLEHLAESGFPHWAASALADYFSDDTEVRTALKAALMGDPVRASKVAIAARRVLPVGEVIPRLLAILREIKDTPKADSARYDIVAAALVQTSREQDIDIGPEWEAIAEEALTLMPSMSEPARHDPRFEIAAEFYPSQASVKMLADLVTVQDRPLVPYLRAYRSDPAQIGSLLGEAETVLRSLPPYLRARVCQSLADGATESELAMRLTSRWAEEVYSPNKSIASLVYHSGLRKAREEGRVDDCTWSSALTHLGEQASCYGPYHEAQRRGAWVGICLTREWSVLKERVETIGEAHPVAVSLVDVMYGPDRTLLQQIAQCWEDLRSEFDDLLLSRLSGIRESQTSKDVWGELALVAHQNASLRKELEGAVADDPEILTLNGALAWFVTRRESSADTVADVLVSHLQHNDERGGNLASALLAEPERLGLRRDGLRDRLEIAQGEESGRGDDRVLEVLAGLFPESPLVVDAWQRLSTIIAEREMPQDRLPHGKTYFAIAFAAADTNQIPELLNHCFEWLDATRRGSFDDTCVRHITHRLRRDSGAADLVIAAVMDPATPDSRAARLVSLLAEATGLDADILSEVERRLAAQAEATLAPIVRDYTVGATHSVRTILTRVSDAAWELPPV